MEELEASSPPTPSNPPPLSSPMIRFLDSGPRPYSISISSGTIDTTSSETFHDDWPLPTTLGNDDASRLQYVLDMWKSDEVKRLNPLAEAENILQQSLFNSRESDGTRWYGTGQTNVVVKEDTMKGLLVGERLGRGNHGAVKALTYNSLIMARKKIKPHHANSLSSDDFKEELQIMKKLSLHNHFVKLAGTYSLLGDPKLYILTFPVAVCTLDKVLEDYEQLRKGALRVRDANIVAQATVGSACTSYLCKLSSGGEKKLMAAIEERLDEALGCMATAVQWMHAQNIRHLDLKPVNIVLNPGELYITDFDLSRDLLERNTTITELYRGHTSGYSAPEIEQQLRHSPSSADIYSLGCVCLHITAVRYGGSRMTCKYMLNSDHTSLSSRQAELYRYMDAINSLVVEGGNRQNANSVGGQIPHLELIKRMLEDSQDLRPSATEVNESLRSHGSWEQKYHGRCCKKNQYALSLAGFIRETYREEMTEADNSLEGYLAITLYRQGRCHEEEANLRAELERREIVYGPEHPEAVVSQCSLAACLEEQGKHVEADRLQQKVLGYKKKLQGSQHPETIRYMVGIGIALSKRALYTKAEIILRETWNLMVDTLGRHHVETVQCLDELAAVLRAKKKYKEAEEKHREAQIFKINELGPEYRGTLETMHRLSLVLFDQGKYEEARVLTLQTLQSRQKTLGRDHHETLETTSHLVDVLRRQGKDQEANNVDEEMAVHLQNLRRRLWGDDPAIHCYIHDTTKRRNAKEVCQEWDIRAPPLMNNNGEEELLSAFSRLDESAQEFVDKEEYEQAEEVYRQTLDMREDILGHHHPTTFNNRDQVAMALCLQERYTEGESMLRKNLVLRVKVAGSEDPGTLSTQYHLAGLLQQRGSTIEAEILFRKTLASQDNRLGRENPDTLRSMSGLASVLTDQENYAEARALYEETLESRKRVLGLTRETLDTMSDIGCMLLEMDRYDDASSMCRQALKLKKSNLGIEHGSTLDAMYDLGYVFLSQNKLTKAEELFRDTLEHTENAHGKGHKLTLVAMDALACVLSRRKLFMPAGEIHRQAIAIRDEVLGHEHPETLDSRNRLVDMLCSQKRYGEAENMCEEILEIRTRVLGEDHLETISTMQILATTLKNQEKLEEAEPVYLRTLKLRQKVLGQKHMDTLDTMTDVAEVLHNQHKFSEATETYRILLKRKQSRLGKEHPNTLNTMYEFGHILFDQGRFEEAQNMFQQTVNLLQSSPRRRNLFELQAMDALAAALTSQNMHTKAADVHRQAVDLKSLQLGKKNASTLESMEFLASALVRDFRISSSEDSLHEAYNVTETLLQEITQIHGKNHQDTLRVQSNLDLFRKSGSKRGFSKMFRRKSSDIIQGQRLLDTSTTRKLSWMDRLPRLDPLQTQERRGDPAWMARLLRVNSKGTVPKQTGSSDESDECDYRLEDLPPGDVPSVFLRRQ